VRADVYMVGGFGAVATAGAGWVWAWGAGPRKSCCCYRKHPGRALGLLGLSAFRADPDGDVAMLVTKAFSSLSWDFQDVFADWWHGFVTVARSVAGHVFPAALRRGLAPSAHFRGSKKRPAV